MGGSNCDSNAYAYGNHRFCSKRTRGHRVRAVAGGGRCCDCWKVCGEVESTKSVSEIFAPLTGTVTAVNTALTSTPEMLNTDPYIQGWIAEIEVSTPPTDLLTAAQYVELTA